MFVLGLGAQKGGTTWLYSQLKQKPGFVELGKKEIHYWDRVSGQRRGHPNASFEDVSEFMRSEKSISQTLHAPYFLAIRALELKGLATKTKATIADITPSYSGLPLGVMQAIKSGFAKSGIDYRVVFTMRDPVDRIVSAFRMNRGRIAKAGSLTSREGVPDWGDVDAALLHYSQTWECQLRSRYELTLSNILEVFDPDQTLVLFTEQLSSNETLSRIAQMLDMRVENLSTEKVHIGEQLMTFDDDVLAEIARTYEGTYEKLGNLYPHLRSIWRGFAYLG